MRVVAMLGVKVLGVLRFRRLQRGEKVGSFRLAHDLNRREPPLGSILLNLLSRQPCHATIVEVAATSHSNRTARDLHLLGG